MTVVWDLETFEQVAELAAKHKTSWGEECRTLVEWALEFCKTEAAA